jgi:pimeloyl-ACP methyl ester carboxylesterase
MTGLPHYGQMLPDITTDLVRHHAGVLCSSDSVERNIESKIGFMRALFVDPDSIPYETMCMWIGMATGQTPRLVTLSFTREQDPSALYKLAKDGLPALIIGGSHDQIVKHDVVVAKLTPVFSNLSIRLFDGCAHAVFYENREGVMDCIIEFVKKVNGVSSNRTSFHMPSQANTLYLLQSS